VPVAGRDRSEWGQQAGMRARSIRDRLRRARRQHRSTNASARRLTAKQAAITGCIATVSWSRVTNHICESTEPSLPLHVEGYDTGKVKRGAAPRR
jgi:hypothetical protein